MKTKLKIERVDLLKKGGAILIFTEPNSSTKIVNQSYIEAYSPKPGDFYIKEKPLWYIKYDPIRAKPIGKNSMRFQSKIFTRLKDAMEELNILSMEKPYSFVEYAVMRWTETSDKIVVQGTIEYE